MSFWGICFVRVKSSSCLRNILFDTGKVFWSYRCLLILFYQISDFDVSFMITLESIIWSSFLWVQLL